MRRLNKRIKKTIGMYGMLSVERYKNLFKKEENKENASPKLPEVKSKKTIEQLTGYSRSSGTNVNMSSFEKEYKEFIENLKKKKEEKAAAETEVKTEEINGNSGVVTVKETLDTVSEEFKPKKKKRKKIKEAE